MFKIIKDFNPNFGSKLVYHFTTKKAFTGEGYSGVKKPEAKLDFKVFPNPSKGAIRLKYPASGTTMKKLQVMNPMGKMVYEQEKSVKSGERIDLSHLNAGLYLIRAHFAKKTLTGQVVLY